MQLDSTASQPSVYLVTLDSSDLPRMAKDMRINGTYHYVMAVLVGIGIFFAVVAALGVGLLGAASANTAVPMVGMSWLMGFLIVVYVGLGIYYWQTAQSLHRSAEELDRFAVQAVVEDLQRALAALGEYFRYQRYLVYGVIGFFVSYFVLLVLVLLPMMNAAQRATEGING